MNPLIIKGPILDFPAELGESVPSNYNQFRSTYFYQAETTA